MTQRNVLVALVLLVASSGVARAVGPQRSAARTTTAAVAVRTVKGNLRGRIIAVRTIGDRPAFDFVLSEARIVDGKLELRGELRHAARRAGRPGAATARLAGTLAKEPNPDYVAARAKRNAARTGGARPGSGQSEPQKPGGPATTAETSGDLGQLAQSTQSTARTTPEVVGADGEKPGPGTGKQAKAASTGASGCEVMYLRMDLPAPYAATAGGRSVQLNVALAHLDNKAGIAINQRICRIVRALGGDGSAEAEVAELNRLLANGS